MSFQGLQESECGFKERKSFLLSSWTTLLIGALDRVIETVPTFGFMQINGVPQNFSCRLQINAMGYKASSQKSISEYEDGHKGKNGYVIRNRSPYWSLWRMLILLQAYFCRSQVETYPRILLTAFASCLVY